jgi:hypothetical protein
MPEAATRSRRSGPRSHVPANALLEKKRQTDRESQRVVRERTKKYISHLENLVDTLQKSQQDERLQQMTIQCKQLHDENERLKIAMASITKTIRGVETLDIVKIDHAQSQSPVVRDKTSTSTAYTGSSYWNIPSPTQPIERFSFNFDPANLPTSLTPPTMEAADMARTIAAYGSEDTHVFVVINNLISKAESCKLETMEPAKDADIAIRAIAHGWTQAEQYCELDTGWQILRQIDQEIFFVCGPVEKLAILRVTRLKLLQVSASDTFLLDFYINECPKHMSSDNQKQDIQALLPPYMIPRYVHTFKFSFPL